VVQKTTNKKGAWGSFFIVRLLSGYSSASR
jgi:hypothetical protein